MMHNNSFIIQGDICWSTGLTTLKTMSSAFLVCIDGKSAGVFSELPPQYTTYGKACDNADMRALPIFDYRGRLVIPGLVDLHTHAPQFAFRGLGMDLELLDWLSSCAFPEETKYADFAYARRAYQAFTEHQRRGPNTRLIVYATVHVPATLLLMDLLEDSGLVSMVGKVNMDRNCPDDLRELSAAASLDATREWLAATAGKYIRTKPILTPRFIPSCSDDLMRGLGALRRENGLPVQSHLSENRYEVEWVRKLCPSSNSYAAAYRDYDLFGSDPPDESPTVMAHCVLLDSHDMELMAAQEVFAAHCPQSNTNLSSGIAPVRRLLDAGIRTGLGSDIAAGASSSMFRAMSDAIQVSKLRRCMTNNSEKPLTLEEAFYLGTAGGGAFFNRAGMGGCGSFEPGCDLDALVINDSSLAAPFELSIRDRLERAIYLSDERHIEAKYVQGKHISLTPSP